MALSDLIRPQIAELGKIKIGGRGEERTSQSGSKYRIPRKDDHFTVTTLSRNADGDLIEDKSLMTMLIKEYGDSDGKLRQIPIALLTNDIEDIIKASYVWYKGKKVAVRSDGVTAVKFFDGKQWLKEPIEVPWTPEMADLKDSKGARFFKLHTTFHCVIASREAKWGGLYKFRTTSKISASQLYGSLLHLKELTGGILRGLPLRLVVRPMQVSPEGISTTVYVCHVELIGADLQAIQSMALQRMQYEVANARELERARQEYRQLLLPPGERETAAEQADIASEFQPEAEPDAPQEIDPLVARLGIGSGNGETHETPTTGQQTEPAAPSSDVTASRQATEAEAEGEGGLSEDELIAEDAANDWCQAWKQRVATTNTIIEMQVRGEELQEAVDIGTISDARRQDLVREVYVPRFQAIQTAGGKSRKAGVK